VKRTLSTSDIAERSGDTREWIWALACAGEIPAERANPGGKQYRYFDSPELRNWCAKRSGKRDRQWTWTAQHQALLDRKRPHLDSVGKALWRKLSGRHRLTVSELRESIRHGRVTKIKIERTANWGGGFATWQGLRWQFDLLLRQIGNLYFEWTAEEKAEVRAYIAPIVEFDRLLRSKGDEVA
jgi:hypothetical protein